MFKLYLVLLLALASSVLAADYTPNDFPRIADAIYKAEGGVRASKPYGILSVKVKNKDHARKICLNTIRNNYTRWLEAGAKSDFIFYLGSIYCPAAHDKKGNSVWAKNVNYFLNKNKAKSVKKVQEKSGPLLVIR